MKTVTKGRGVSRRGDSGATAEKTRRGMSVRALVPFFGLTFGLSWGVLALLILLPDQIEAIFGELNSTNPLFILAVYSPGIAGVLLVWWHYGLRGLGNFFRRLTLWRMPVPWWVFLVIGIPAIVYVGAAISGTFTDPFPFSTLYATLSALTFALLLGPIEELGWRGVGLPLLQRRLAPLWSGLILGVAWATWHAPAFLLSGTPQSTWSFVPFFVGVVMLSVVLTPMFNAAGGSILIAVLFHFQAMNPIMPDAQPWDTLIWIIAAVVIVVINRKSMLTRKGAVTEVLMPGEEGSLDNNRVTANS
ncbi:MAG: type II CAAX endopeptidase family protein [Rubrobacteraceae bacterium]